MFNIFKKKNTNTVSGGAGLDHRTIIGDKTLLFRVFSANGGIVLNCIVEDPSFLGQGSGSLYVIKDAEDLSDRISKIITLELMK